LPAELFIRWRRSILLSPPPPQLPRRPPSRKEVSPPRLEEARPASPLRPEVPARPEASPLLGRTSPLLPCCSRAPHRCFPAPRVRLVAGLIAAAPELVLIVLPGPPFLCSVESPRRQLAGAGPLLLDLFLGSAAGTKQNWQRLFCSTRSPEQEGDALLLVTVMNCCSTFNSL
jgi:hypothetical protein